MHQTNFVKERKRRIDFEEHFTEVHSSQGSILQQQEQGAWVPLTESWGRVPGWGETLDRNPSFIFKLNIRFRLRSYLETCFIFLINELVN